MLTNVSIRTRVMRGLTWTALAQLINATITFAVSVALARLLAPQDFGLMAMAVGAQSIIAALVELGLAALIIRTPHISEAQLNGLFRVRLVIGALQAALTYWLAPAVAAFFEHPEITPVLRSLIWVGVVASFSAIPDALLRKRLEFRMLTLAAICSSVTAGALGVAMAWAGFGLWSLVAQYIASALVAAILLWHAARWLPRGRADYSAITQQRSYVLNTYGLNMLGSLVGQGDRVILGRLLGAGSLGLYMRGLGLGQQLQAMVGTVAEQVGFPSLSAISADAQRLKSGFLEIVAMMAGVLTPVMFALAVLAQPLVVLLFGEQWAAAAPVVPFIALGLLCNAINITWDWLLRALGRPDILLRWGLFDGGLRIAGVAAGAAVGDVVGAAIGFLATAAPLLLLRAYWMGRAAQVPAREFLAALAKPVLISSMSALPAWLLSSLVAGPVAYQLAAGAAAGALAYALSSVLLGNPLLIRLGLAPDRTA
jgi:O-antigen/teichoic acid export membrane protein